MIIQHLCPFPVLEKGELKFEPDEEGQFAGESIPKSVVGAYVGCIICIRTRRYS